MVKAAACSTRIETHKWQSKMRKPAPQKRRAQKDNVFNPPFTTSKLTTSKANENSVAQTTKSDRR